MINWEKLTKNDTNTINKICDRYLQEVPRVDRRALHMDISATHVSGNKLKLAKLLRADDGNFMHDVNGIIAHIDRDTGKLMDCFSPRFSR